MVLRTLDRSGDVTTLKIRGKKGDSENMRNTIYLAFLSVGGGNSGIEYTIYIV